MEKKGHCKQTQNRQVAADITKTCIRGLQEETAPRWHQSLTKQNESSRQDGLVAAFFWLGIKGLTLHKTKAYKVRQA